MDDIHTVLQHSSSREADIHNVSQYSSSRAADIHIVTQHLSSREADIHNVSQHSSNRAADIHIVTQHSSSREADIHNVSQHSSSRAADIHIVTQYSSSLMSQYSSSLMDSSIPLLHPVPTSIPILIVNNLYQAQQILVVHCALFINRQPELYFILILGGELLHCHSRDFNCGPETFLRRYYLYPHSTRLDYIV